MMDVLLLADLHGNYGKLDAFLSYDYDAVIIAGDITNFGPLEPVDSVLSRFDGYRFCNPRKLRPPRDRRRA
jgi:Icc-related predicted phosphoesterase